MDKLITDFLEYLEIERGRSELTIRNYDFYLRRFQDWAENPTVNLIDREMVKKYRLWLNRLKDGRDEETLKKSTQNYHLIALRSFLKYLSKQDIRSFPAEQIELAKQSKRTVEFLEVDELNRLLTQPLLFRNDLIAFRDKAILELLFSTGMRVSELTNLQIENVNLKRDEFTIRGKGDKPRIVFFSSTAKDALRQYLGKRHDMSPFMFISHDRARSRRENSGPITSRSVQRIVERYSRSAGISKTITPHTLRHTFATDLLMNGADIRSVQSLLGHESITTTQVYTHITNQHMQDVYKRFHGKTREH